MHRSPTSTEPATGLGDDGTAALEFIVVGLILLVPVVYLIVALGLIQGQLLGVESGARHIARAVATAENEESARQAADAVLRSVTEEYGLDADAVQIALACEPAATPCPQAGATVRITVTTRVSLPLVPPVLGLDELASVPIEATSAQKVSQWWAEE